MSHLTHVVLVQFAQPFDKACYSKLTSRERAVVDMLIGLDYLVLTDNRVTVRCRINHAA